MKISNILLEVEKISKPNPKKKRKKTITKKSTTKITKTLSTDKDFIKIAEECRKKIIGTRVAKFVDCEDVSIAIAKALIKLFPSIMVIDGRYDGRVSEKVSARGHVWCYLPSKQMIIDGTHDQFNPEIRVNIIHNDNIDFKDYFVIDQYKNIERFFFDEPFTGIKQL